MDERRNRIPEVPLRVRAEGSGFALEGRGFYVWDEDEGEVLRVARELARGRLPRRSPRRLLLVQG